MAWNRMGKFVVLSLTLIFAACGGDDSGNNGVQQEDVSNINDSNEEFRGSSEGQVDIFPESSESVEKMNSSSDNFDEEREWLSSSSENKCECDADYDVESYEKLPHCTSQKEGHLGCVVSSGKLYICSNLEWIRQQGESSSSFAEKDTSSENSSSSFVSIDSTKSSSSSMSSNVSSSSVASSSSLSRYYLCEENNYPFQYDTLVDERDGQAYKIITIGTQTWMAENLNYDYNVGTARSYCYNNVADSCDKYGRLYLWSAAMDSAAVFSSIGKDCGYGNDKCKSGGKVVRGVCPNGWHLPDTSEWRTLSNIDGNDPGIVYGGSIYLSHTRYWTSTTGWYSEYYDLSGCDTYGFSALPAGVYGDNSGFGAIGNRTLFWSSTWFKGTINAYSAYGASFSTSTHNGSMEDHSLSLAGSVRCLKDSN